MHALGYVHRDLKPANVMWLPRQKEAVRERRTSIEARPAQDAWSLGVTAFELLTGSPAFDLLSHGRGKVCLLSRHSRGNITLRWTQLPS